MDKLESFTFKCSECREIEFTLEDAEFSGYFVCPLCKTDITAEVSNLMRLFEDYNRLIDRMNESEASFS